MTGLMREASVVYYVESNRKFKRKNEQKETNEHDEVQFSPMIREGSPGVKGSPGEEKRRNNTANIKNVKTAVYTQVNGD